ncbi:MAG: spermidine synthase [Candidatus Sumerlaeota bacterium]|nr:spermidine synthase [Candidatus Sumerlaeota bacterium]
MPVLDKNWFCEVNEQLWPGRALALRIKEVLYEGQSQFQHIRVFRSDGVGLVLTLDGVIQLTESDEFAYQEMQAHVPLFAHSDPHSALVVGGGDGGVVREIARHPGIERIDLCEIDPQVIEVSRRYLPFMAGSLDDPRVAIHVADGAKFVADHPAAYDVIIVDSSDPVGPAEVLYREKFYRDMRAALKPGGIILTQAESPWLHKDLIEPLYRMARQLFRRVAYCYACVPTYPSGQIGLLVASDEADPRKPVRRPHAAMRRALRYYTPEIHRASFALPAFARQFLGE